MRFFIQCFQSKKNDNKFCALCCDLGYRVAMISFDYALLSEISARPISDIRSLDVGECIEI